MGTQPISLKNQLGKAKENGPNWWTEYHCQCKTVDMGLGHHAGIKYCGCAEIFNEATCKSTVSFGRATAGQTNSDGSIATTMAQNPKGDGYHATALGTAPDNCARHNSWCCNWAKCVGAHGFQETECQWTQNGCVPKPNANKCIWKKRERIVYKKVQGNKQFIYSEVGEYAEKEDVDDPKAYVRNKDLPIYTGFCPKVPADCQGDIIGATRGVGIAINTLAVIEPTKTTLGTDAEQRKTALAALQRADASDLAYVVLANGKKCSSAEAITTWNECKIAKDYLKIENEELNCDVRWSNGSPAWTTCVKVAPYKTHCKWVANVGCKKKILNYHGLYSKPAIGKCEDTGGEVITSLAACQTAAKNLGLGRVQVSMAWGWGH